MRRGNEYLRAPERLSARYAITKRCPPIRCLHNRIELHLACLVLFYDIKVIVFSEKCKCVFLPCILATFRLNILFSQAHIGYINGIFVPLLAILMKWCRCSLALSCWDMYWCSRRNTVPSEVKTLFPTYLYIHPKKAGPTRCILYHFGWWEGHAVATRFPASSEQIRK